MENIPFRIGHGYDVHRLVEGRKLIMGGVEIPYEKGLLGHSDADVLLHAVSDALLGALALGDIGKHFPDTDPAYAGADSLKLLELVVEKVKAQGYAVVCGADEAGAGPLAGPVYAAAVSLPDDFALPWLNDSKKVTPKRREVLFDQIKEQAVA